MDTMMSCGHVAQARGLHDEPVCAICVLVNPLAQVPAKNQPELEGRIARCTSCRELRPSSLKLAFFEYRGPNSSWAMTHCKNCMFILGAHVGKPWGRDNCIETGECKGFEAAGPHDYDAYYCGCRGWD